MSRPPLFEIIKPIRNEEEYGFQINLKNPSCSFFAWIDLTKRKYKYTIPFFNFEICEYYGLKLKIGKLNFQFTKWNSA